MPDPEAWRARLTRLRRLVDPLHAASPAEARAPGPKPRNMRRLLSEKDARIAEPEANLAQVWEDTGPLLA